MSQKNYIEIENQRSDRRRSRRQADNANIEFQQTVFLSQISFLLNLWTPLKGQKKGNTL
jgi:hypothetical protein